MKIEYVTAEDQEFWFQLDAHISKEELLDKISRKMGYVIFDEGKRVGLLRYNLFWDNTPFCTMLFIDWDAQRKGYGKMLVEYWETDMKSKGYKMLMTSTQVDESAQHFYRKLGYQDAGCLVLNVPSCEQPMEMFFVKGI